MRLTMNDNYKAVKPVFVPPTRFYRILDLAVLFLLLLMWILAVRFNVDAPELVPTGFDVAGRPRGWGSPLLMYSLMPGMATVCAVFFFIAYRKPQFINLPVTLKELAVVRQSVLILRCVRWVHLICQLMFLLVLLYIGSFQYGYGESMTHEFLFLLMTVVLLLFVVTIVYSVRISNAK